MADLPRWAKRIRAERQARGWSIADAVRVLRTHGDSQTPSQQTMERQWKRWEAGGREPGHWRPLIARTFGTVTAAIFPLQRAGDEAELISATGMDTLELITRLRGTDISDATLDALEITVDRLGAAYSRSPAEDLRADGQEWLRRIGAMRDQRLTFSQHRQLLSLAGRVALLVGCVEYDLGLSQAAEATRQGAASLGNESGDMEVVGWSYEMAAWYALTKGHLRSAVAAAEAGLAAAGPSHSVVVQLNAHRAKAWARMRERREVEVALNDGRAALNGLAYPTNIASHFVVDPSKWDFYCLDVYRHVGEDEMAKMYAEQVIQSAHAPDGTVLKPMRVAEAEITLGVVAARSGELEGAVAAGRRALTLGRRSLPSLAMNARELVGVLRERFPEAPAVGEFEDELRMALAS